MSEGAIIVKAIHGGIKLVPTYLLPTSYLLRGHAYMYFLMSTKFNCNSRWANPKGPTGHMSLSKGVLGEIRKRPVYK